MHNNHRRHEHHELQSFLLTEWQQPECAGRLKGNQFFVTNGGSCFQLSSVDGESVIKLEVPQLQCTHEEADTRLLLHAVHAASNGCSGVVIRTTDTGVAVLAIALNECLQGRLF